MKRLMAIIIAAVLANSLLAQTTSINESFETWPAPEWTIYQYEYGGGWFSSTYLHGGGYGYGGGNAASHKIENDATDDWLVTPQISVINANYELVFYEYSEWAQYYTYAGVHISTGSGDPADGDFVELTESVHIDDIWTERVIDLSAYNGQNIYIAFVFQGATECWHKWSVDEVRVSPSTLTDGGLTAVVNPTGINPNTGTEDVIVSLYNFGTETINDADFVWRINGTAQTTYEATGLNLPAGDETNITVGQYDFATQGDYIISVNVIINDDSNPGNDTIEAVYYVTDPKDAALKNFGPEGYTPVPALKDVTATVSNEGDYTIDDLVIEWSVNGETQTDFVATSIGLAPGEETVFTLGQYNFQNGLSEITGTVNISGDEDLSNNTHTSYLAVGILWESFEGSVFPPEMWSADDYPLKDYWDNAPQGEYYYVAQTDNNMFGAISDTLYTPLLQIETGNSIHFWVKNSAFFTNNDQLIWKDGSTGEVHYIQDIESELEDWDEVNIDISAAEGINYIGFVNNNNGSFGTSSLDMITSDATIYQFVHDLGIRDFQFEYLALADETHSFYVSLRNYGTSQVSGGAYSVQIMTEAGELLAEQAGVTLDSWEETTIEVTHTFTETEVQKVYAVINYSSDEFLSNNTSKMFPVYSVPANIQTLNAGFPEVENLMIPFNTGGDTWTLGTDDLSQNLYYQDELTGGYLYGVTLYYNEIFGVGQYLPLQVWVKETSLEDLTGGWIPTSEMQEVFNDTINVYPGSNAVYIPFNEPILITGESNLAIQYYQYNPEWPFTMCRFYTTNNDGGPVRTIRVNDVYELDPNDQPEYWAEHTDFVYTTFVYQPIGGEGIISGHVYDENDEPMQWAVIEVEGADLTVNSDENGYYEFPAIPYETYNITATMMGYSDETTTVELNQPEQTVDFYMELLPLVSLYGTVYGSNAPDIPLEGVEVSISGYDNQTVYTNANGEFLFENVYGNKDYNIAFHLYGYHDLSDSVIIADTDMDYGTVLLNEIHISAYNIQASPGEDNALIIWQNPITSTVVKHQNDTDTPAFSYTNEPYEDVWLGNVFENQELITVTSVEVYWDIYENAHDFVTIEILDGQGNVLVSSEPFLTFNDSLMVIDVPNITLENDYYAMVHWQNNPESTDALAYDYNADGGVLNTASIMYPGQAPMLLSDYMGNPPASFLVRVYTLEENENRESREVNSYNVYRGLVEEMDEVNDWEPLNTEPVTSLSFIDNTWSSSDPQQYVYAVEAVYTEGNAEKTFSNFIAGTTGSPENELKQIIIYPNPAYSVVNISGIEGSRVVIYSISGNVVYDEKIKTPSARIDVNSLANGTYFVRITGSQAQRTKKLVIAK